MTHVTCRRDQFRDPALGNQSMGYLYLITCHPIYGSEALCFDVVNLCVCACVLAHLPSTSSRLVVWLVNVRLWWTRTATCCVDCCVAAVATSTWSSRRVSDTSMSTTTTAKHAVCCNSCTTLMPPRTIVTIPSRNVNEPTNPAADCLLATSRKPGNCHGIDTVLRKSQRKYLVGETVHCSVHVWGYTICVLVGCWRPFVAVFKDFLISYSEIFAVKFILYR